MNAALSKAHELAHQLICELEELKDDDFGTDTIDELKELHETADALQSDLYDLIQTQI